MSEEIKATDVVVEVNGGIESELNPGAAAQTAVKADDGAGRVAGKTGKPVPKPGESEGVNADALRAIGAKHTSAKQNDPPVITEEQVKSSREYKAVKARLDALSSEEARRKREERESMGEYQREIAELKEQNRIMQERADNAELERKRMLYSERLKPYNFAPDDFERTLDSALAGNIEALLDAVTAQYGASIPAIEQKAIAGYKEEQLGKSLPRAGVSENGKTPEQRASERYAQLKKSNGFGVLQV